MTAAPPRVPPCLARRSSERAHPSSQHKQTASPKMRRARTCSLRSRSPAAPVLLPPRPARCGPPRPSYTMARLANAPTRASTRARRRHNALASRHAPPPRRRAHRSARSAPIEVAISLMRVTCGAASCPRAASSAARASSSLPVSAPIVACAAGRQGVAVRARGADQHCATDYFQRRARRAPSATAAARRPPQRPKPPHTTAIGAHWDVPRTPRTSTERDSSAGGPP